MQMGTMPLPIDVQTLPLYLAERWRGRPFDNDADFSLLLRWARAGNLVFWWLLLAYGMLIGRSLAGTWGGRLAVALLAVEPSLLAHAALATTDVAVSACLLALLYHFRAGRDAGWGRRVGWPMLWCAAAILAKASGLVFGVICMGAVELERLWTDKTYVRIRDSWRSYRRDVCQIVCGGLALVFVYCGSDWQPQASTLTWARQLPEGPMASVVVWLVEHFRVFTNAGEGIARQFRHNVAGHGAYLLGHTHPRALWYYFPVALTIKFSVPLLLAPGLIASVRSRALKNWAVLAAAALLAFTPLCRVQLGVRLMLPLVTLAAIGLAAAAVNASRELGPLPRRLAAGLAATAVVCTGGAAVAVWPDGLCYINTLWGGTAGGYRLVTESNYDWGQGLKELRRWQQQHGPDKLRLWYFGADPAQDKKPFERLALHDLPLQKPADVLPWVRGSRLAVSTTLLYGPSDNAHKLRAREFFAALQPAARTSTFFIYDFTTMDTVPVACR
jgi:hypothetical protein